jgi:hypothetical protein
MAGIASAAGVPRRDAMPRREKDGSYAWAVRHRWLDRDHSADLPTATLAAGCVGNPHRLSAVALSRSTWAAASRRIILPEVGLALRSSRLVARSGRPRPGWVGAAVVPKQGVNHAADAVVGQAAVGLLNQTVGTGVPNRMLDYAQTSAAQLGPESKARTLTL